MSDFAYLNGELIPAEQLHVAPFDLGFVQGVTVTERLRTFAGKIFRLNDHLQRLRRSLEIVGIDPDVSDDDLAETAEDIVARNYPLLPDGGDLSLCIYITPGPVVAMAANAAQRPTVAVHTHPLRFELWADKYEHGESLVVSSVPQIPADILPRELKCRSRMHYYLADQKAAGIQPGARAVLLDTDGVVTEATTANLLIHRKSEGLISPPRERILPGISLATVEELAADLGVPFHYADFTPDDLLTADEVLLASTSVCLLPVTTVQGQSVADGSPGPVFLRLMKAWNQLVGIDIIEQAARK